MLRFDDMWVWDSWTVKDGDDYHLFYLQAPRSPMTPDARHFQVSIGHATSTNLSTWTVLPTALRPAEHARWDDYTTWTGSIVRDPAGRWLMFYTGTSREEKGLKQRIGAAQSFDLLTWERLDDPPLEADPRWYEQLESGDWHDEAWRDPYVVADPNGDGWHMLITARSKDGLPDRRGVIGHAWSRDLTDWEIRPPLTSPGYFGHLEVPQVVDTGAGAMLVFSCRIAEIPTDRRDGVGSRGIWTVEGPALLGPYDVGAAVAFDHPSLYAARLVRDPSERWNLLGFRYDEDGFFIGELADPIPVQPSQGHLVRNRTQSAGEHSR